MPPHLSLQVSGATQGQDKHDKDIKTIWQGEVT